ncbi:hypothetical protein GCM10023235_21730 [Kitasatospora terrestris]|uniref:Secreted protein n=1 Tax=Kitasatospora terrestris TaxID=258051 RepID=A0ABP9DKE6_9ACTN
MIRTAVTAVSPLDVSGTVAGTSSRATAPTAATPHRTTALFRTVTQYRGHRRPVRIRPLPDGRGSRRSEG